MIAWLPLAAFALLYPPERPGYWCVVCQRHLPADDLGVIVHGPIAHPISMTFDEEERPQ